MSGVVALRPGGLRTLSPVWSAAARRRRPEWWLYVVAAAGWLVFAVSEVARVSTLLSVTTPGPVAASGHDHAHHGQHAQVAATDLSWWDWVSRNPWLHHGLLTLAMVAVMVPLIAPNVRYAALRSSSVARRGVTLAVVWGWASRWLVIGLVVGVVGAALAAMGGLLALAAATLAAAGWQWSRTKRRSVARCHRVVAPPLAPAAARSAGRAFGRGLGRDCASSCLPLMLLMAVSGHVLVVTVGAVGVAWYERRRRPHHKPARGWTSAVVAATGGVAMLMALVVPHLLVTG